MSVLNERKSLMSKLGLEMAGRGLPVRDRDSRLTILSVIRVLRDVLIHQSAAFDPEDVEMGLCFRRYLREAEVTADIFTLHFIQA